ncbi:MAG: hypothetical protein M1831_004667 [Alyxoria varia]|nr:MAG: hypothetical protein M1831_004667 [Alyxoria varia]
MSDDPKQASADTAGINLPPRPSDPAAVVDSDNAASAKRDTFSPDERSHRRDSLEKHLQIRPDAQDLKNRNILHDTPAAPGLQSAQHELERQRAQDSLKKGLEARPDREELEERNILPQNSQSIAPGLQDKQRDLERHMRADSLDKALKDRPKPEKLVEEGILSKDEVPVEDD